MNTFPRPPIESMRPVVSFAIVRLLLPAAALLAALILGFPHGAAAPIILGLAQLTGVRVTPSGPWPAYAFAPDAA